MYLKAIIDKVRQRFSVPQPYRSNFHYLTEFDEDDIITYPTTNDILASGRFTPEERRREYRRRGKSPSGVIDGIGNNIFQESDMYNRDFRDWEAGA